MSRPAAKPRLPASDEPSVLPTAEATERWQALFGCPAPHRSALIDQAIAWKEQALAHGDLPNHILRDLRIVAHQVSETRQHADVSATQPTTSNPAGSVAPRSKRKSCISSATRDLKAELPIAPGVPPTALLPASSQLAIGAQLVKHHAGETHVVEVTTEGFAYRDQTYASLSAIAKVITGTHWNGLLFFGLRRRKTYARKPRA